MFAWILEAMQSVQFNAGFIFIAVVGNFPILLSYQVVFDCKCLNCLMQMNLFPLQFFFHVHLPLPQSLSQHPIAMRLIILAGFLILYPLFTFIWCCKVSRLDHLLVVKGAFYGLNFQLNELGFWYLVKLFSLKLLIRVVGLEFLLHMRGR